MDKPPVGDVLEHYGGTQPIARHGWQKIRCPFHGDRQASASVNTERNLFRCFACDIKSLWGGQSSTVDSLDLIAWKEGVNDFNSAVEIAESLFGGEYGNVLPGTKGKSRRRVFGEGTRPKRGQRDALSARVRRRTFNGA